MSRGREVARGVLRSYPKPARNTFSAIGEGLRNWSPVFYTSAPKYTCIRRLAGARHVSWSFCEHCDQGVGRSPNERAPFRFHGAVVGFVDRCVSRTRNLAASNEHNVVFFSSRSWPKICPGIISFGVCEEFETFFFEDLCS